MDLWIYIGVWIICGIASQVIARIRGVAKGAPWFLVGTLLGPFGLILALMGGEPPKPEYTMETLNQLGELRAKGVLSHAEYEARRGELLGRDVMPGRRR